MMTLLEIMQKVNEGITKDEASAIFAAQVEDLKGLGVEEAEARRRVKANIGYFAGYYSAELQDKAYDLFETEHPIFGRSHPTPEEALRLGIEHGQRMKAEHR